MSGVSTPYYEDELVTLYHGDCLEFVEWLTADVLVTDPPYGIGWARPALSSAGYGKRGRQVPHDGISNDDSTDVRDAALSQWGSKPSLVFGSWSAVPPSGKGETLVWRKPATTGVFGARRGFRKDTELIFVRGKWPDVPVSRSSVFETDGHHTAYHYGHPHSKPVTLLRELIDACPDGAIADPFAGSGSTLVAARISGRRCIGVELDERYCEIAARRLGQQTFDLEGIA